MQPGLSEVAGDVEADPGAVFEDHGAESVDELVAGGTSQRGSAAGTERDDASDRAVSRLFESDLDRPERTPGAGTEPTGSSTGTRESTTTPSVLADLERAIEAADDDPGDVDAADLALDDADVEDALAAAAQLEDGDLPESVPDEWRGE